MDADQVAQFQFAGQDIPWLLDEWVARQPDKPLLVWEPRSGEHRTWSYAAFVRDARRLAVGLSARGVGKGDMVVIHADNCPEMVLAWYACAHVGAVGVTTNTRSVGAEMRYFIEHTGAVAAITQPQYAAVVADSGPALKWIAVTADDGGEPAAPEAAAAVADGDFVPFEDLFGDDEAYAPRPAEPMLPAGIMFTSGTTSRPKAVVHTHANALWAAKVGPTNISIGNDDTYLIFLPFFHVNAQSWSMWTTVLGAGGTIVLQPKFSSSRFWEVVVRHGVTHISIIPFVLKAVAGQPVPESRLRVGVFGLVMPQMGALLGGVDIVPAYGMTETVIHATGWVPNRLIPQGSMGKPTPGYEVLVVDQDTGEICAPGEVGELWVRGTRGIQLFLEYYGAPEANEKSFTEDGWFKTGDRVRQGPNGELVYSERDKDVLKVGGENVSAKEIEDLIRTVPGVGDVAVVGRSHEMLDVVPVAFVIAGPDAPDEAEHERLIIERCAADLSDFKVPRAVHRVEDFPRATLDKVAKNKLRDRAEELAPSS
ncbi:MAG: acyl--CoA ligase [Acidimicrobiales bacterium]|jgi:crotonobetaine/carnitine-CoA ligase|nr:acyl--CoA ligase [Acidimicrobiales bacterium]